MNYVSENKWTLVCVGGEGYAHADHYEWMISSEDCFVDGTEPLNSGAPGSIAYLPDLSQRWMKNANGAWVLIEAPVSINDIL